MQKQVDLQKKVDEFEALNEELNKRNEELLIAKRSIEESEKRYSFLAQTANELVELTSINEIYAYAARKINQLLNGRSIVAITEFNYAENRWKMMHLEGLGNKIAEAIKLFGFDLRQAEGELSTKYYEEISSGKLAEIEFDLSGLLNNRVSTAMGKVIKNSFSIGKLYCITFQYKSQIAGNFTLITNHKTGPVNSELIEAFVNQVSNFLQKQKAELALRESADLLAKSQEIAHLGSWQLDLKTNHLTWSNEVYRILGCQPQEFTASYERFLEFIHPEDKDLVDSAYTESVKQGKDNYEIEHRIIRKNTGEVRIVLEHCVHERDDEGVITGSVGMIQDITKQKQIEEALRESEKRFKNMFERHSAIMLLIDPLSGIIIDANEAASRFYGYSKAELLSMKIEEINSLSPEHIKLERKHALLNHRNYFVFQHSLANGDIRTVEVHSSPITIKNSQILFSIIHDITERRKTEDELRKISTAVEQSPASVVITNLDGNIEYVNPKFSEITGYTLEEAIGQNPRVLKSGKQDAEYYSQLWKTISSGREWKGEFYNKKKNGEFFWESASISPIVNAEGKITHYIAIKEDITYRKQAEEAQQHLEIAKQTIRFKQNFLANMSHEIRTPLTGVLGMIEILENTQLDLHQKDYINTLKTSGESLKEIINQVLDFSKIEAGKISISPVTFEFASLTGDVRLLYGNNKKQGVKLLTDTDPKIPTFIKADRFRLTQILNNLVSNALKFTHDGSVEILSKLESSHPQTKKIVIRIEVKDTGIGIPQSLQGHLFTPFSQIDNADTRKYEGTGLGLSICKQLVEIMGGTIGMNSEQGKGSNFWFTFPAMIAEGPTSRLKENISGKPKRMIEILLAEDKAINQKVISLMITSMGHNIHIACNGKKALEMFEPEKFDLILMDIQMPVMDGVTATQKLKEKYDDLPPIVGLSANAFEGDREKYMNLGMDEYLTKPVKKDDFEELIRKLIV